MGVCLGFYGSWICLGSRRPKEFAVLLLQGQAVKCVFWPTTNMAFYFMAFDELHGAMLEGLIEKPEVMF